MSAGAAVAAAIGAAVMVGNWTATAEAALMVFCERGIYTAANPGPGQNGLTPIPLGQIPGIPGQMIHIIEIGIGGDASQFSGPAEFRAHGGGVDFDWVAGQTNACLGLPEADHILAPTPLVAGSHQYGFTYAPVNYLANDGAAISVEWVSFCDADGHYTDATDSQGNYYNDAGVGLASVRAWILYEYIASPVAIEATTWGRVKALTE